MGCAIESDDINDHLSNEISSILKKNSPDGTLQWTTMSKIQRVVRNLGSRPCLSIKLKDGKGSDLEICVDIARLIHERVASIVNPANKESLGEDFMVEIYRPEFLSSSVIYPLSSTQVDDRAAGKLRDTSFEITRKKIGGALLTVGLYMMHPESTSTSEQPIPTVGVMVQRDVVVNWDSLQLTLEGEATRLGNFRVRLIAAGGVEERVSYGSGLPRPTEWMLSSQTAPLPVLAPQKPRIFSASLRRFDMRDSCSPKLRTAAGRDVGDDRGQRRFRNRIPSDGSNDGRRVQ